MKTTSELILIALKKAKKFDNAQKKIKEAIQELEAWTYESDLNLTDDEEIRKEAMIEAYKDALSLLRVKK